MAPEIELQPILLVDDDVAGAKLLIRRFRRVGVENEIIHLDHGDRALAYLTGVAEFSDRKRYPLPILIILDLKLPGIAGLELLPVIRRNRDVKAVPVVILTGEEDDRVMRGAYELGANSYLVKSADESKFLALAEGIRNYWLRLNRTPSLSIKKTFV